MISAALTAGHIRARGGGHLKAFLGRVSSIVERGSVTKAEEPPGQDRGHLAAALVGRQAGVVGREWQCRPPGDGTRTDFARQQPAAGPEFSLVPTYPGRPRSVGLETDGARLKGRKPGRAGPIRQVGSRGHVIIRDVVPESRHGLPPEDYMARRIVDCGDSSARQAETGCAPDPRTLSPSDGHPSLPSRSAGRSLRKFALLAGAGFVLSTNTLDLAFQRVPGGAQANPTAVSGVFGYVYDIYTLAPLDSAVVTLNGAQYVTGPDGLYAIGISVSGVPESPPAQPEPEGFGCAGRSTEPRMERATLASQSTLPPGLAAGQDTLTFSRPGHWTCKHYVGDQNGIIQVNASLPRNVSPRYNIAMVKFEFGTIWYAVDVFPDNTLFTYLPSELPIPVDGSANLPSDRDLLVAMVADANAAAGMTKYVIAWGNGHPQQANPDIGQPEKRGIYVYHNSGQYVTLPLLDSDTNPTHLIGAICILSKDGYRRADRAYLDHEAVWRATAYSNGSAFGLDGIFNTEDPRPMTLYNQDHLLLLDKIAISLSAVDNHGHRKQDLNMNDLARP